MLSPAAPTTNASDVVAEWERTEQKLAGCIRMNRADDNDDDDKHRANDIRLAESIVDWAAHNAFDSNRCAAVAFPSRKCLSQASLAASMSSPVICASIARLQRAEKRMHRPNEPNGCERQQCFHLLHARELVLLLRISLHSNCVAVAGTETQRRSYHCSC